MEPASKTAQEVRTALAAARADMLAALEKGKSLTTGELLELRQMVEEAIGGYEALLAGAKDDERAQIEHTLGRQVIDLRRVAALVPQMASGTAAKHSADKVPGGGQPFIESRPPPRWLTEGLGQSSSRRKEGLRPGDEVEAWCGPCNGLRSHHIIAMIGSAPKQVLCQSCGARHGYRLTPARIRGDEGLPRQSGPVAPSKMRKTPEQQQEERRKQELARLGEELAAAQQVVPFDPRRRYKAGEVVEHPEYGRGKIETALRTSIVVRFATGRRSLVLK